MKITDEMVERACRMALGASWISSLCTKKSMRDILEAALNPPAAPEMAITEAMLFEGDCAYEDWKKNPRSAESFYHAVYRAMRKLEPLPHKAIKTWNGNHLHYRETDRIPGQDFRFHRRSTDK